MTDPADPQGSIRTRTRLPAPSWYVAVLILAFFAAFALHMRFNGILACPAAYDEAHYLGHCQATAYGDYDHGAFWFGSEPEIRDAARSADVLFLGNSRLQFGFSAPALGEWFRHAGSSYYLLGFSHTENITFVAPLLRELQPRARVYVINTDDFFTDWTTGPAADVMNGADTRGRYRTKRTWQNAHRALCTSIPSLCGNMMAFYRHRETGEWLFLGEPEEPPSGIEGEEPLEPERVEDMRARAETFLAGLDAPRECVLLTYVPSRHPERGNMQALADALHMPLYSPQLAGLTTVDSSHLDRASANRFVAAFLQEAEPQLRACLALEPNITPAARP